MTFERKFFVMSVDVDSWSSLLGFYSINHNPSEADFQVNIDYGIMKLLNLFGKHDIKATFFFPGEVARKHGQTIKAIIEEGHELACHGLTHEKNECLLPLNLQISRIQDATRILRNEAGCDPKGFRAPCLRANGQTIWILERLGYAYDSSVLPSFIPGYYGYLTNLSQPYHPSFSSLGTKGCSTIIELPVSVNPIWRIPLSAAWMRNLGANWVKIGIKTNFYFNNPVVFYVHPRDVTPLPKVDGLPWHLYKNTGLVATEMLSDIIEYAKKHAEIITALELAQMFNEPSLQEKQKNMSSNPCAPGRK